MIELDWFFRSPRKAPQNGEKFSQLYLLRRDIDTCFGTDPNTGLPFNPIDKKTKKKIYLKAIWPGTMAILAGIDLLGKFLAGSDKSCGKGKDSVKGRFKEFVKRYIGIADFEASLLYQLRNSLLHSFGLYSEIVDKKGNVKATYNFIPSQGLHTFIQNLRDDFYQVDVNILREKFNDAINKYEIELRDNSRRDFKELNKNFSKMYSKHAKPMCVIKF